MDLPSATTPEPVPPAFEALIPHTLPIDESDGYDLHREINARRSQLENPELLRRLRSL